MGRLDSSEGVRKKGRDVYENALTRASPNTKTRSKGQFFMVSAVMITGVFLVMSLLFKTYSLIETSDAARVNEDLYFNNIKSQFSSVLAESDCTNMDANIRDYKSFVQREVNALGYWLFLNYTIQDCNAKQVQLQLLLASHRFVISENVDPANLGIV